MSRIRRIVFATVAATVAVLAIPGVASAEPRPDMPRYGYDSYTEGDRIVLLEIGVH
jgi:hypothetical protein